MIISKNLAKAEKAHVWSHVWYGVSKSRIQNFIQCAYISVNESFDSTGAHVLSAESTRALGRVVLPPLQTEMFSAGYRHSKGRETDFI